MKVSRPGLVGRVQLRRERERLVSGRRRAELAADRVPDVAEVLHVRAVELAGALADPDHVRGDVVGQLGPGVDARHRVLVLQQQRLVGGVEVDPVELVGVGADRLHEGEGAVDLGGHRLVVLADRAVADELGVPGVDLAQVGVATGGEGAHQVQRRRRRVVDVQQSLRVGTARVRREVEAVDGVAAVGRQRDAVASLHVGRARLGVLPGKPPDLDHRHRGGVGQHDRHLQQHPELVADVVGRRVDERLRAVAALEDERLAAARRGDLGLELVALARKHQRRHASAAARRPRPAPPGRRTSAAARRRGRATAQGSGSALVLRRRGTSRLEGSPVKGTAPGVDLPIQ